MRREETIYINNSELEGNVEKFVNATLQESMNMLKQDGYSFYWNGDRPGMSVPLASMVERLSGIFSRSNLCRMVEQYLEERGYKGFTVISVEESNSQRSKVTIEVDA